MRCDEQCHVVHKNVGVLYIFIAFVVKMGNFRNVEKSTSSVVFSCQRTGIVKKTMKPLLL